MPNIGYFHPQIVHFVVALAYVGVIARVISLLPLRKLGERIRFAGPMGATLIIISAIASVAAAQSGTDAHPPVERIPGARAAVQDHEDAGEWARDILVVVALLEVGAIVLSTRPAAKWARVSSAVVGVVGLAAVFRAAQKGGDLVYRYGGGVGIRSKDTTDVTRLLVAGLFNTVQQDRAAGHGADAARLVDELARRMPGDTSVRFMVLESRIRDRNDAAGALLALDSIAPGDNRRLRFQKALMTSEALEALGKRDSARTVLEALRADFGQSRAYQQAMQRLNAPQAPR